MPDSIFSLVVFDFGITRASIINTVHVRSKAVIRYYVIYLLNNSYNKFHTVNCQIMECKRLSIKKPL